MGARMGSWDLKNYNLPDELCSRLLHGEGNPQKEHS
jgi:hypothetical protein